MVLTVVEGAERHAQDSIKGVLLRLFGYANHQYVARAYYEKAHNGYPKQDSYQ